jgi:hypothetical protein
MLPNHESVVHVSEPFIGFVVCCIWGWHMFQYEIVEKRQLPVRYETRKPVSNRTNYSSHHNEINISHIDIVSSYNKKQHETYILLRFKLIVLLTEQAA